MQHGFVLHDAELMQHAIDLATRMHSQNFGEMSKEDVTLALLYEAYPWFCSYQLYALWQQLTEQELRDDQKRFLEAHAKSHATPCANSPAADGIAIFVRMKHRSNTALTPAEQAVYDRLARDAQKRRHPHLALARAFELCGVDKPPYFDHLRQEFLKKEKKLIRLQEEAAAYARLQLVQVAVASM